MNQMKQILQKFDEIMADIDKNDGNKRIGLLIKNMLIDQKSKWVKAKHEENKI